MSFVSFRFDSPPEYSNVLASVRLWQQVDPSLSKVTLVFANRTHSVHCEIEDRAHLLQLRNLMTSLDRDPSKLESFWENVSKLPVIQSATDALTASFSKLPEDVLMRLTEKGNYNVQLKYSSHRKGKSPLIATLRNLFLKNTRPTLAMALHGVFQKSIQTALDPWVTQAARDFVSSLPT